MAKNDFDKLDNLIEKEFSEIIDLSKVDTKVPHWYDIGVYAVNYICSKNLFGGIPKGRITGIEGLSGTGKSLLTATVMRDPTIDRIFIIETEGGGNSDELITFANADRSKVRIFKTSTFNSYCITKSTGKIEEISDAKLPKARETDKYIYKEGASTFLRRLANTIEYSKVKPNILIIMDSLGNMQSVRALTGTSDMGKRAQDITNFFKNFDNEFERSGLTFIFTNKMYQNMGQGGPFNLYNSSGGEAPIYNSSLYLRLSTTADTDDVSTKEDTAEKERRKTALGSSLKTIKAKVQKSRFGTEMRSIPFLLDFVVGPVRLSGLFRLLTDFGVIEKAGGSYYAMPGIIDKKFFKKDFTGLILENEKEYLEKIQKRLDERETEIKQERSKIQASDIEEVEEDEDIDITDEFDEDELKKAMVQDKEGVE